MDTDYLKQAIDQLDQKITEAKQVLDDPVLGGLAKEDIEELERQKAELQESATTPMHQATQDDDQEEDEDLEVNPNVAIIEIRPAAGGDEAGLFASDLLRMY